MADPPDRNQQTPPQTPRRSDTSSQYGQWSPSETATSSGGSGGRRRGNRSSGPPTDLNLSPVSANSLARTPLTARLLVGNDGRSPYLTTAGLEVLAELPGSQPGTPTSSPSRGSMPRTPSSLYNSPLVYTRSSYGGACVYFLGIFFSRGCCVHAPFF